MEDIINNFPTKDDLVDVVNKNILYLRIFAMFTITML